MNGTEIGKLYLTELIIYIYEYETINTPQTSAQAIKN